LAGGDMNGDGYDDLLVGAPYDRKAGPISGRAWVYFGGPQFDLTPDLELSPSAEGSGFGGVVAYLGDFNGDGFVDFAVGASNDPAGGRHRGALYIYYGGPQVDDRADLVLRGKQDDASFGVVRQETGDVNGDGYADIAVASERGDGLEPRA